MIISASCRTDLPAFYGEWFLNRLRAGYCMVRNPYSGKPYRVSLAKGDVDGVVLWTKHIGPMMRPRKLATDEIGCGCRQLNMLEEVREMGYPFVVTHTVTNYPKEIEKAVVDAKKAAKNIQLVAKEFGERVVVWRYDPIILTSVTGIDWHLENFKRLCAMMEGATDEVVVEFLCVYKKTQRNMDLMAKRYGYEWGEIGLEARREMVGRMVEISGGYGIGLTVCSEPGILVEGAKEARCIDAVRMSDVAGYEVCAKQRGTREHCLCHESRDIGEYDTCPHGCVYCYAVRKPGIAVERFRKHDPASEYLFGESDGCSFNQRIEGGLVQLGLFDE